jgi:hypothetical protein
MESLNEITKVYLNVVKKFLSRTKVLDGEKLSYRKGQSLDGPYAPENRPRSFIYALNNTGFCVSASQALLYDPIFILLLNSRGAHAKMISIDIKERFYGSCKNGLGISSSQNKWHTALLVRDGEHHFIIDITCGQFGNAGDYLNRYIWSLETWEKTFRSETDKHRLTGFDHDDISKLPIPNLEKNTEYNDTILISELHNVTTITDSERSFLADFLLNKVYTINKKLLFSNVSNFDFAYLSKTNKLLKNFGFESIDKPVYCIQQFRSKQASQDYVDILTKDQENGIYTLKQYLFFSKNMEESSKYNNIDLKELNSKKNYNDYFVIIILNQGHAIDMSSITNLSSCLLYGVKLYTDFSVGLYNGIKTLANPLGPKTNTIYLECKTMA